MDLDGSNAMSQVIIQQKRASIAQFEIITVCCDSENFLKVCEPQGSKIATINNKKIFDCFNESCHRKIIFNRQLHLVV